MTPFEQKLIDVSLALIIIALLVGLLTRPTEQEARLVSLTNEYDTTMARNVERYVDMHTQGIQLIEGDNEWMDSGFGPYIDTDTDVEDTGEGPWMPYTFGGPIDRHVPSDLSHSQASAGARYE